jgi:hypothetical protein
MIKYKYTLHVDTAGGFWMKGMYHTLAEAVLDGEQDKAKIWFIHDNFTNKKVVDIDERNLPKSYNGAMSKTQMIGWSDFALKHSARGTGNSYTSLEPNEVAEIVDACWNFKEPGDGETDCSRKVLVTIPAKGFFLPPKVKLADGLPVQAEVVKRQAHEDPYIETFVTPEDAAQFGFVETPAVNVKVVLYSAEALTENNEERSTECDWEIVCILCDSGEQEPMAPLTMARNFLEKEGGTKSVYTAQEFAEAIYSNSNRGVRVRPCSSK